jgi:acyl-CoA synthetase (AMP-forming)/AMP-acid ligase II
MTGSIADILERNARLFGGRIGYVDGDRRLTHRAYLKRCRAIAGALHRRGARRQDRIAVLAMNSLEYMELYGACELSGFILATLNFRLTAVEIEPIVASIAPTVLVFDAQYANVVAVFRQRLQGVRFVAIGSAPSWAEPWSALRADDDAGRAEGDDIAHLIFTSGSTGRPKGCMLGQRELARKFANHASDLAMTDADRVLIMMPLFHVGARGVAGAAQWRGAALHIENGFDPPALARTIAAERITVTHMAPTMVQSLLEHPDVAAAALSSLRALYYAAAPMPDTVLRKGIAWLGPIFHQSYGQSEGYVTALLRHQHRIDGTAEEQARLLSVGQPCPGVEVRLLDEAGADVAPGEVGEIVYRGGVVLRGYWNDRLATAEALRDGWMHSGDMGRFDADGFLYIVDRKKDMIISGGENIYCREIEDVLLLHAGVAEAAVIGVPDPRWGETVHAVIVVRADATPTADEIIAHCRAHLASFKKPTGVTFVAEIPKLATGKHDKPGLRQRHSDRNKDADHT